MIHVGDCLAILPMLESESVQMCVTSPPYWGLRDYGVDGQIGLESTPQEYVEKMVAVFRGVRRVLRDDGTLWLNLGDSYSNAGTRQGDRDGAIGAENGHRKVQGGYKPTVPGLKNKDLCGIPWRVAFALQSDGWYLRQDIIWAKPNPMPESVRDRCTKAHEYIFLLAKSERYYYDADAIAEPFADERMGNPGTYAAGLKDCVTPMGVHGKGVTGNGWNVDGQKAGRNKRSVWTVATQPYSEAHFATFPPALIEPCILAGSKSGDTVLDPFFGSGTTGEVCDNLGRKWIGIELNSSYVELAKRRASQIGIQL